jgi:hypothetical protein
MLHMSAQHLRKCSTSSLLMLTPLAMHTSHTTDSLMAAAVLLAWSADLLVRACEERIPWLSKHHVISGFRLFKLSMCTALALICAIRRTTLFVYKSEWFFRLSGLCLDLMAVGTCCECITRLCTVRSSTTRCNKLLCRSILYAPGYLRSQCCRFSNTLEDARSYC